MQIVWKLGLRAKMRAEGGGEEREERRDWESSQSVSVCAVSPTSLSLSLTSLPSPLVKHCTGWTPAPRFPPPGPVFIPSVISPALSSSWLSLLVSDPLLLLLLSLLVISPRRPSGSQHGEQINASLLNMGSCLCKGHQGQSLADCFWVCLVFVRLLPVEWSLLVATHIFSSTCLHVSSMESVYIIRET